MTPMKSSVKMKTARAMMLSVLVGTTLGLGACGRGDENTRVLEQAKRDLEQLAATGGTAQSSYDKLLSDLAPVADSTREAEAVAARLLRSRAYLRQGDEAAVAVTAGEQAARGAAMEVRSLQDRWVSLNAQARGLGMFDATASLAQIEQSISAKLGEIAKEKEALAAAEARLKELQDKAAAATEKSRAQRDTELAIRNQMISKTQTERAELVRQANDAKRVGDDFDLEAADFMAQAGRERPQIAELQMRVQRLELQKTMLDASKGELQSRVEQSRRQAERALKGGSEGGVTYVGAQQVAEQLTKKVAELNQAREAVAGPSEEANGLYDKALSEISRAKSGGGAGGSARDTKLAEAAAHHSQADLLLMNARGLEAYAGTMKVLAETKPALPQAAEYAKQANDASAQAAEKLKEAQEAFVSARDLYEAAGASQKAADVKGRLEQVVKTLAVFDTRPAEPAEGGDDAVAEGTDEKPATDDKASTEPTQTFEGEKAEVYSLLRKLVEAMKTKDPEAIMPLLVFRNSQQEEHFRKMTPILAKFDVLDEACIKEFGRGFAQLADEVLQQAGRSVDLGAYNERSGMQAFQRLRTLDPNDLEIEVLPGGTEAEVRFKSARTAHPIECMKLDDGWRAKLDFEMEGRVASEKFLEAEGQTYDTITENLRNGKYAGNPQKMIIEFGTDFLKRRRDLLAPTEENK